MKADKRDAQAVAAVANSVRGLPGGEALARIISGLRPPREEFLPWIARRLRAIETKAPWLLPSIDPESWVSLDTGLHILASRPGASPALRGKTGLAAELATLEDDHEPKPGLDELRAIYLLGIAAIDRRKILRKRHIASLGEHIRGLQRWRPKNPASRIPDIAGRRSLAEVKAALDRHWEVGEHPAAKAWRDGWSPWLQTQLEPREDFDTQDVIDPPIVTALSGPSQPGVDFGTVLPPDLPGVDIVAPPPSATAKGAKPLGRAFAAAFAHQAVRSSNSLLLKQHVSVASDPEVELVVSYGLSYPYANANLSTAVSLAILQLQIATGRNLPALLDTSILPHRPAEAAHMTVDLDTGAWTQPSLRPPDGFTPEMQDRHAFESPSFEVTFDLPPALTKILKTVHERHRSKARRLVDWFDGQNPEEALRGLLRGIPGVRPIGREPSRYRRWLASQLQEVGGDLVQTMLLCGDSLGRSLAPLYYHSPMRTSLQALYRQAVWPLFQSGSEKPVVAPESERVGPAYVPKLDPARSGVRWLAHRLNESADTILCAGPARIAEFHNRLVDYLTHFICIVTSHRPTRTLYALTRFSFDVARHVCVLQDKRVDLAHVTRLSSTSPRLSAQISSYLGHLRALADSGHAPSILIRHIGHILAGEEALLVYLDERLTPRTGHEADWKRSRPSAWSCLPDNWYRSHVATRLRDIGVPAPAVFCQLGHLESAGQPFGRDSPVSPILVMRELRAGLQQIESGLGFRVVRGLARSDYRAPLPPLRLWKAAIRQHESVENAVRRAELQVLRATMKENRVRANEWLMQQLPRLAPSAAGPLAWLRENPRGQGKGTPFWRARIAAEEVSKLLSEANGSFAQDRSMQAAIHNLMCRRLRSAVERLQVDADDIGLIAPRPLSDLSPFLADNCLATQQLASARRHLAELRRCDIPSYVRATLALCLYGKLTDADQVVELLTRPWKVGSVPSLRSGLLAWRGDGQSPVGLSDFGAIALSTLDRPMLGLDLASLGRAIAPYLPEKLVGNPDTVLVRLCATADVAARIECSGIARATLSDFGATDASPQQQAAFFARQLPDLPFAGGAANADPVVLTVGESVLAEGREPHARAEAGCWNAWERLRRALSDPRGVMARNVDPRHRRQRQSYVPSREDIRHALDVVAPALPDPMLCRLSIVDALATFTRDMVIHGTVQKKDPAASTITTYVSVVGPSLIHCFAGVDLRDLEPDDFEDGYRLVIEAATTPESRRRAVGQARHFHAVLQRVHGLEPIEWGWAYEYEAPDQNEARPELISDAEYQRAVDWLRQQFDPAALHGPDITGWRRHCFAVAVILVLLRRSGARINEIVRLRHEDWLDFEDRSLLVIRPSRFRRLKTGAARRLIDLTHRLTGSERTLIREWVSVESRRLRRDFAGLPLFATLEYRDLIVATQAVRDTIQAAFRASSGRTMWPHLLRHAWVSEEYPKAAGIDRATVDGDGVRAMRQLMNEAGHQRALTGIRSYLHVGWRFRAQPTAAVVEDESLRWVLSWVSGLRVAYVDKIRQRIAEKPPGNSHDTWIAAVAAQTAPAHIDVRAGMTAAHLPVEPKGGHFSLLQLDGLLRLVESDSELRSIAPAFGLSAARADKLIAACDWLSIRSQYRLLVAPTRLGTARRDPPPRRIDPELAEVVALDTLTRHCGDISELFVALYSPFEARRDRIAGPIDAIDRLYSLTLSLGLPASLISVERTGTRGYLRCQRHTRISGFHSLVRVLALVAIWPWLWS